MADKDGMIEIALALVVDADGDSECWCEKVSGHDSIEDALDSVVNDAIERFDSNIGGSNARRVIKGIVRLPVPTDMAQAFTITLKAQKPDEGATVELS